MGGAAAIYMALVYPELIGASLSYAGAFYASDRTGDPYQDQRHEECMMPTENEHNRVWGPPGSDVRSNTTRTGSYRLCRTQAAAADNGY